MKLRLPRRWRPILVAGCVVLGTSCEDVSVTAVDVASLTLTPGEGTIAQGDTVRLRAILHDASGNSLSGRVVEWSTEQPDVVALEANGLVRGLTVGTAIVRASSGGATGEAWITVMEGPVIVLSTTEFNLQGRAGGPPTDPQSVEISNGGGGTLTGLRISVVHPGGEPAGWLEAGLLETSAPTVLLLRGNPEGLSAGEYRPQIRVSSDQAANSPQVIEILFEVDEEAPAIEVKPRALGFSMSEGEGAPAPQTVAVTNVGAGELTDLEVGISYVDGEPTGWLDAELAGTAAPTELTLRVDPEGLKSPLVLDGVVEITSPAAPGSVGVVHIRFRLGEPAPEIELDRTEIDWDIRANASAPPAEVSITNRGGGTLEGLSASVDYDPGEATGWLDVRLSSTQAPSVLRADLTSFGLSPGQHRATIRIEAPDAVNSPRSVSVLVLVAPAPGPCRELDQIGADLKAIEDANPGSDLADEIEDVREEVEEAYYERCVKNPPDRKAAAKNIKDAVDDMLDIRKDGLIGASQAEDFLDRLLGVSRTMAIEAIEEAEARGGRWSHILRAYGYVSEGDRHWSLGSFKKAASSYESAISRAEGA
jgi:hypothetical protein